ncbi:unnamed protein product [Diatraea saccharalis]|uniref:Protein sleepless n=1 Tax=Diatraea saccharalis TaxID=40085 RepID=A0A9N9WFN3_9NEOP|nr:unnamed protein product [Diatraea saccharalis]
MLIVELMKSKLIGSSITCYECNSALHPQCEGNMLPDTWKRNCSDHDRGMTHTLCRKIVQHVDFGSVNGQLPASRVIRTCGWDDSKYKSSCYHRAGFGGRQEVCSCTKDLCNKSSDVRSTPFMIISTAAMIFRKYICQ